MLSLVFRFKRILSLLVALFISIWLTTRPLEARFESAHGLLTTVLAPIQFVVNFVNRIHSLSKENANLRTEIAKLKTESELLRETSRENRELRHMIDYREKARFSLIPAEVSAQKRDLLSDNLIMGVGSHKGVLRDMPVITLEGVVGKVIEVYPFYCNIQLVTDPNARTGALFSRLNIPGILECRDGRTATISVLSHYDIKTGDTITTSGLGGIFPKGLYIGRVLRILPGTDYSKTAEISLHNGLSNIEHVFVLAIKPQWRPFKETE